MKIIQKHKNESLYGKKWAKPTAEITYGRPSNKKPVNAILKEKKGEEPVEISKLLFGGYDTPFDPNKKSGV